MNKIEIDIYFPMSELMANMIQKFGHDVIADVGCFETTHVKRPFFPFDNTVNFVMELVQLHLFDPGDMMTFEEISKPILLNGMFVYDQEGLERFFYHNIIYHVNSYNMEMFDAVDDDADYGPDVWREGSMEIGPNVDETLYRYTLELLFWIHQWFITNHPELMNLFRTVPSFSRDCHPDMTGHMAEDIPSPDTRRLWIQQSIRNRSFFCGLDGVYKIEMLYTA